MNTLDRLIGTILRMFIENTYNSENTFIITLKFANEKCI